MNVTEPSEIYVNAQMFQAEKVVAVGDSKDHHIQMLRSVRTCQESAVSFDSESYFAFWEVIQDFESFKPGSVRIGFSNQAVKLYVYKTLDNVWHLIDFSGGITATEANRVNDFWPMLVTNWKTTPLGPKSFLNHINQVFANVEDFKNCALYKKLVSSIWVQ